MLGDGRRAAVLVNLRLTRPASSPPPSQTSEREKREGRDKGRERGGGERRRRRRRRRRLWMGQKESHSDSTSVLPGMTNHSTSSGSR